MFFRSVKEYWWLNLFGLFFSGLLFFQYASAQGTTSQINLSIPSAVPNLSVISDGDSGLIVSWDWNYLGASAIPGPVLEVRTEITSDGINFTGLQISAPGEFSQAYPSLTSGTYSARVTVMDGNDYTYIVGPVTVTEAPIVVGGGGGRPRLFESTDLTLNGVAYPGPTTVVIFTYQGGFETIVSPNIEGVFSYHTDVLPVGVGTFSFSARDPNNILSAPVTFDYDLPANSPVIIDNIYLPPTIRMTSSVVTVGEIMEINGYGFSNGSVSLLVNGPHSRAYLVQADDFGYWNVLLSTTDLGPGTYDAVAKSTSSTAAFSSPDSETLVFELVLPLPAAPVCGNGLLESPEQCDDGNTSNGDQCSSNCQLESGLPQSSIDQPAVSTFTSEPITLTYTASSPSGAIDLVEVYYSRNGDAYQVYPTSFFNGTMNLSGLPDGQYEVYSIARDDTGAVESAPPLPDATFEIDQVVALNVLAYPEKRSPAQGNWGLSSILTAYDPSASISEETFSFLTDHQGRYDITASSLAPGTYHFLLKGISHLSKRLENRTFQGVDLLLDFSLGGTFYLLGGDVHSSKDDYVNGLDLSSTVLSLYSGFLDADLNQDGFVNGMDLSIIITNLYQRGDGV